MADDLGPGDDAELRSLRARAYGASADIGDDPGAVRRLAELERQVQLSTTGAVHPPPAPDDSPLTASSGEPDEPTPPPVPPVEVARAHGSRLIPVLVWALSILVTAALAVGVTVLVTNATSADAERAPDGSHRVAVLDVDPGFVPSPNFLGGDTRGFTPFEGMTAISTTAGLGADDGVPCLLVVATDDYKADSGTIEGTIYSGCRAKEFPASAQFVINAASPAPLRDRFGVGRGIRFILEGGHVGVYVVG